jgi:predicted MFS family arabinose efflux permease
MWGALGWATTAPLQHILFERQEKQEAMLAVLNTSTMGFGSAVGTVLGGVIIAAGFKEISLPFFAAILLLGVLMCLLMLMPNFYKEYQT